MNVYSDHIKRLSQVHTSPHGKEYRQISIASIAEFSQTHGIKIKDAEIMALETGVIPSRYQRNIGVIGSEGQILVLQSRIAIIGLGGLGGMVVELLARAGTGSLVLADHDSFDETNLNRQILCHETNIGLPKTDAAVERVRNLNSAVETEAHFISANNENIGDIIEGAHVVIDGLDTIPSRFQAQNAAKEKGIPFVHGAVAGFSGQVLTIFPEDKGLESIYGPLNASFDSGIETHLGTPTTIPALVASWQAQEALKIIVKKGNLLRNRLLYMDGEKGSVETIQL